MRFVLRVLAALVVVTMTSTPSSAFDDNRKGFLLGFGVGPGITSFEQELTIFGQTGKSPRESKAGLATDFKLGWGLSEQLILFYDNRVSWFGLKNVLGESVTIANGASTAAVAYYLETRAPSVFFTGGVGLSAWGTPFESGTSTSTGFGVFGGGGYEFTPRLNVEGTIEYGNPKDSDAVAELQTNTLSFRVTLNLLGY